MLNSKPSMIYGGANPSVPSTTRRASRSVVSGRVNDTTFSSLLPNGKTQGQQSAAPAAQGQAPSSLLPGAGLTRKNALSFLPNSGANASTALQNAASNIRPASAATPPTTAATAAATAAATTSTGKATRQQARKQRLALSQEEARALASKFNRSKLGAQARRSNGKTAPRISGTPITGRNNIGMVDTRRKAGTALSRNASTHASAGLASSSSPSQMVKTQRGAAQSAFPPNMDYTKFMNTVSGYGIEAAPGSFMAQGFAGKNARLAMKDLGYDYNETRSIATFAKRLEQDPYGLKDSAVNGLRGLTRPGKEEAARTSVLTASHKRRQRFLPDAASGNSLFGADWMTSGVPIGALAAKFESGSDGVAAIGYDRKGGTSYGKYQISSRAGSMDNFISFLQGEAPDIARRLKNAGPSNTGSKHGRMPNEWRKISNENAERFENLQAKFIRSSHFEPAKESIEQATGVTFDQFPAALQEVLFSTAVQHGPAGASKIISRALRRVGVDKVQNAAGNLTASAKKTGEQLITQIYNLRETQFASSTKSVQTAVRNRLRQEMREAIQMLA